MASLVNIDYNPLRRATSIDYSSRAASDAAKRIDLTRQSLSNRVWQNEINKKNTDIQQKKLEEQERQKKENAAWTAVLGVVKTAAGVGMMFIPGGQIIGAGLIAGGGVDIVGGSIDAAGGSDFLGSAAYSKTQQGISLAAGVGQQLVNYQTKMKDESATDAVNRMMATQAAQQAITWNINSTTGELGVTQTPDMSAAIAMINEEYGGNRGDEAFQKWQDAHLAEGAGQYLREMTQAQVQITNSAIEQYVNGTGEPANLAEEFNNTIAGLGGTDAQRAEVSKNAWQNAVGRLLENDARQAAVAGGDEALDSILNGNTSTPKTREAAAQLEANIPTVEQYEARGYSTKDARRLAAASAPTLGQFTYDESGKVVGINVNEAGKKELRQIADNAVKKKTAELTARAAQIFNENIKAQNPIETAAEQALSETTGGNIKNNKITEAVESKVFALRQQALTERFNREESLSRNNQDELTELMKKYEPKKGDYSNSFKGMEGDQEYYYERLKNRRDELKARADDAAERAAKADKALSLKAAEKNAKDVQAAAADARQNWIEGRIPGDEWMSILEMTKDVILPSDYNKWMQEVVTGGMAHNPTKNAFSRAQKFLENLYEKGGLTSDRKLELYRSLYDTRMALTGDNIKPFEDAVKQIMDVETAGYLEKAMTDIELGSGLNEKDFYKILNGDLDPYFGGAYGTDFNRSTGKVDVFYKSQTVGGERMEKVMETVKKKSGKILADKLGLKPEEVKMRMMTDESGDPEGYYAADVKIDGRKETLRLKHGKGIFGMNTTEVYRLNSNKDWEKLDVGWFKKLEERLSRNRKDLLTATLPDEYL